MQPTYDTASEHELIDRAPAETRFPGTRRFVCIACRFATDDPAFAAAHQDWIRSREVARAAGLS